MVANHVTFTVQMHAKVRDQFKQMCEADGVSMSEGLDIYFEIWPDPERVPRLAGETIAVTFNIDHGLRDDIRTMAARHGRTHGAIVQAIMCWAIKEDWAKVMRPADARGLVA